jgi:hypothetical protein
MLRSQKAADSVPKDVYDGDTVGVLADGDFGVRLLCLGVVLAGSRQVRAPDLLPSAGPDTSDDS